MSLMAASLKPRFSKREMMGPIRPRCVVLVLQTHCFYNYPNCCSMDWKQLMKDDREQWTYLNAIRLDRNEAMSTISLHRPLLSTPPHHEFINVRLLGGHIDGL
jgi:hypothetical protein